ncbi:hypothetical protein [Streptomyces subrutilus]|uniref:hypothetical protein n=1 Tax=Streptomyces subrutilus TaxID=36818 RepID=UPI00142F4B03|nr:hypothetical protein [Streptomyces subrutilus]
MTQVRCNREVLVVGADDGSSVGADVAIGSGSDLLDRALVGWERFIGTFEGVPDE